MVETERPVIKCENLRDDGNYARIVLEPLERGYGHTLGNSLRRVLLSSLPGHAVVCIKIDGVLHEFSTIPGVKEDVVEIVLNIKGIKFKCFGNEPKSVFINEKNGGIVTASNIKCDSDVEVLNPSWQIANLNDGYELNMELIVSPGRGYVSSEDNKKFSQSEIGSIAVDSLFSPVLKTTYFVENTRVGDVTDFERLILEVETNGSLSPCTAVENASHIMMEHLMLFSSVSGERSFGNICQNVEAPVNNKYSAMPIENLGLSARSYNSLRRVGIQTVGDLIERTYDDMSKVRNLGAKSLVELASKLEGFGLYFADGGVEA